MGGGVHHGSLSSATWSCNNPARKCFPDETYANEENHRKDKGSEKNPNLLHSLNCLAVKHLPARTKRIRRGPLPIFSQVPLSQASSFGAQLESLSPDMALLDCVFVSSCLAAFLQPLFQSTAASSNRSPNFRLQGYACPSLRRHSQVPGQCSQSTMQVRSTHATTKDKTSHFPS